MSKIETTIINEGPSFFANSFNYIFDGYHALILVSLFVITILPVFLGYHKKLSAYMGKSQEVRAKEATSINKTEFDKDQRFYKIIQIVGIVFRPLMVINIAICVFLGISFGLTDDVSGYITLSMSFLAMVLIPLSIKMNELVLKYKDVKAKKEKKIKVRKKIKRISNSQKPTLASRSG